MHLGTTYYGFGNLIACVASGLLALTILERTIRKLIFLTFVANQTDHRVLEEALLKLDKGKSTQV